MSPRHRTGTHLDRADTRRKDTPVGLQLPSLDATPFTPTPPAVLAKAVRRLAGHPAVTDAADVTHLADALGLTRTDLAAARAIPRQTPPAA